jgi:hypothetical protein
VSPTLDAAQVVSSGTKLCRLLALDIARLGVFPREKANSSSYSSLMESGEILNAHDDHPKIPSSSLTGRNREFGFRTMKLRLIRDPGDIYGCTSRKGVHHY